MRQLADAIGVSIMFGSFVILLGCVPSPSSTDDLQPFVAVGGNYAIAECELTPAPEPNSDVCEACNGTGKSDGTVTCPTCNGTGKKTKSAPKAASTSTPILIQPAPVICRTGTCSTQRIVR